MNVPNLLPNEINYRIEKKNIQNHIWPSFYGLLTMSIYNFK